MHFVLFSQILPFIFLTIFLLFYRLCSCSCFISCHVVLLPSIETASLERSASWLTTHSWKESRRQSLLDSLSSSLWRRIASLRSAFWRLSVDAAPRSSRRSIQASRESFLRLSLKESSLVPWITARAKRWERLPLRNPVWAGFVGRSPTCERRLPDATGDRKSPKRRFFVFNRLICLFVCLFFFVSAACVCHAAFTDNWFPRRRVTAETLWVLSPVCTGLSPVYR